MSNGHPIAINPAEAFAAAMDRSIRRPAINDAPQPVPVVPAVAINAGPVNVVGAVPAVVPEPVVEPGPNRHPVGRSVPPQQRIRSKSWLFTLFGSDDELSLYETSFANLCSVPNSPVLYGIIGRETCPQTGRSHLQGYAYLSTRVGMRSFRTTLGLPQNTHCEAARGSAAANKEYCSKEGQTVEIGDFAQCPVHHSRGGGSTKSSSQRAVELFRKRRRIRDGINLPAEETLSYNSIRLMEAHAKYEEPRAVSADAVNVTCIYGASGVGKSLYVSRVTKNQAYRPINFKWWEGYDGDRAVVFDDIRGDFCKFHELLKVLDIYPFRVETKGGSRQLQARNIFLTSPRNIVDSYGERTAEEIYQLERRIHNLIEFVAGEPDPEDDQQKPIPGCPGSHALIHKGTLPEQEYVVSRMEEDQVVS